MRGITVTDAFVNQLFGRPTGGRVNESVENQEVNEIPVAHSCPLCESELEEPVSDERLQEHIDFFLGVINENFDIGGEDLDESYDESYDEEE